jgi:hypothetical protein
MIWSEDAAPDIKRVFEIANSWTDLHAYPMTRVRHQVIGLLARQRLRGQLTAARLKRMPSIRKKLRTRHLDVIQDLAGVRIILPSINHVEAVADACRSHLPHRIYEEDDYIACPRPSGYRSLHLKLEYIPASLDEQVFEKLRVELQVRSRLQHAWATTVESVGLFRGENLKGGVGDPDWLRLLILMSSEMARLEGRPEAENAPPHAERVAELRELDKKLAAASFLDSINQAVDFTDRYYNPDKSDFYLITFDKETRHVSVNGFNASSGAYAYHQQERLGDRYDTVLVASDKIESLKRAFPNYFGDVQHFARLLRRLIKGKGEPEYVLPSQGTVPKRPPEKIHSRWLRRSSRQ